jgi:hypothetical protein
MACKQKTTLPYRRIIYAASHHLIMLMGLRSPILLHCFRLPLSLHFYCHFMWEDQWLSSEAIVQCKPRFICIVGINSTATMAGDRINGQDMTRTSPPPFHIHFTRFRLFTQTVSSAPLSLVLRFFVPPSASPQSTNPATAAITSRPPTPISQSTLLAAPLNTTAPAPIPAPELALGVV